MPPSEFSGPDNEHEWQDEPSEKESMPRKDDHVEEEIDSNLAFLNPLISVRSHQITTLICCPDCITVPLQDHRVLYNDH